GVAAFIDRPGPGEVQNSAAPSISRQSRAIAAVHAIARCSDVQPLLVCSVLTLSASWLTTFRPFTTFHLVTAVVGLILIALICIAGRRLRGTPAEPRLRVFLAALIILEQIAAYSYWAAPSRFDLTWFLPLHPCRLVVWLAAIALLSNRRPPRAILYFWSFSVCCQPILTPQRFHGLSDPDFWFFWFSHLAIFCAA